MLPHFSFRTCVQIQQVSDVDQVFLHLGAYGAIRFLLFSTSVYGHGFSIHVLPKRKKLFGNSRGQRSVEERKTYPFRRFSVRPTYGRTLPQNVGTDPRLLESGRGNDYPLSKKCVKQRRKSLIFGRGYPLQNHYARRVLLNQYPEMEGQLDFLAIRTRNQPYLMKDESSSQLIRQIVTASPKVRSPSKGREERRFFLSSGVSGALGRLFPKTRIYSNHCAVVSPAPAIHNYNESRGGSRFLSGIIRFAPGLGEESERWVRRRGGEKEGKGSSPDDPG